jgi:hypothetical protein
MTAGARSSWPRRRKAVCSKTAKGLFARSGLELVKPQ